jgi:exopolyphosphatase/guanosine-5'-triphosphate,3'-diphosphate pyrophosphatase
MPTRAVIDIGTNSVKLLVADVSGGCANALFEESEQTRLGAGFYETHRLSASAIEKTAEAVRAFAEKAHKSGAVTLDVIATSAARDAVNGEELAEAIRRAAQKDLRVISGEQEAEWAFSGVACDPMLAKGTLLVMDIGGGSTEFVIGANGHRQAGRSFQIGTVRLLEKVRPSDPPTNAEREKCLSWLRKFFADEIKRFVRENLQSGDGILVSTGGTASILGRLKWKLRAYDREKIEGTVLSAGELADRTAELWALPLEARKQLPGMPASRADVIIMGAAILEAATESLGFSEARISTRGLRFGALLHVEKFGSI